MKKPVFGALDQFGAIQLQEVPRGLKFWIKNVEELYYLQKQIKDADQQHVLFLHVTMQLISICFLICKKQAFLTTWLISYKVKQILFGSILDPIICPPTARLHFPWLFLIPCKESFLHSIQGVSGWPQQSLDKPVFEVFSEFSASFSEDLILTGFMFICWGSWYISIYGDLSWKMYYQQMSHLTRSTKLYVCTELTTSLIAIKFLNFWMPEIFAVIYLKFKQRGQTWGYFVIMMQME